MRSSIPAKILSVSPLNWQINQLPGLSVEDCAKLINCGITTTLDLLQKAGINSQREALAVQLAVPVQNVHKWVVFADLSRIPAVGCQYCGLLVHCGICSIDQLARTPLDKLQKQVMRFQVQVLGRADLCPTIGEMAIWIEQAQQLIVTKRVKGIETRFS